MVGKRPRGDSFYGLMSISDSIKLLDPIGLRPFIPGYFVPDAPIHIFQTIDISGRGVRSDFSGERRDTQLSQMDRAVVEGDFILGHECAGEVVDVGAEVQNLQVGDRVALEPGKTCGKCKYCKEGKYNLCPEVEFFATPPYHGVFTNYVTHPEDMCFKLPDNVSYMEGALVEPLAVGLHASVIGDVKLGDTVVIFGSGCIGLATLLSCKAKGASRVYVVDILENRLKTARKLGADDAINAKECDVIQKINELTDGKGADIVIETAGSETTVQQTADVVSRGGAIVLVGMTPKEETCYNFMKLVGKEAQLKTIFRYRNLYPVAISAISSGTINVKDIVSHEYDFDHVKEAFDFVVGNAKDVVKAIINID